MHYHNLCAGEELTDSMADLDGLSVMSDENPEHYKAVTKNKLFLRRRLKFTWFCLQNYYTAPVNKFIFNMVS